MRSDWEKGIADEVLKTNPDLEIELNNRDIIPSRNSERYLEIDIYIPELKLAFELNGESFHDHEQYHLDKQNDTTISEEMYKKRYCEELDIKLVNIWSSDDQETAVHKINKRIRKRLNKQKKKKKKNSKAPNSMMEAALNGIAESQKRKSKAAMKEVQARIDRETFTCLYGKILSEEECIDARFRIQEKLVKMGYTEEEAKVEAKEVVEKSQARVQDAYDRIFGHDA